MNTSRKAVGSRANVGQMLESTGLGHLLDQAHVMHSRAGAGDARGRGHSKGSEAAAGQPERAEAVKAAMAHAWRG